MMFNDLKKDFIKLLEDHELCDGFLVARGETEQVPVHKLVLATRSEYFKAAFYGKFASSASLKFDYDTEVLKAIKQYCYTDTIDVFRFGLPEEGLPLRGRFLVQLVAAADYLLLPELSNHVLEQVYNARSTITCRDVIPFVYSEAKSLCVVSLEKLARHIYWSSQKRIETDIPFEPADPEVDYHQGVFLVVGCSAEVVNGEYCCTRSATRSDPTCLFKKTQNTGLEIVEWDGSGDELDEFFLCLSPENEIEHIRHRHLLPKLSMYTAWGWENSAMRWTMTAEHEQRLGRSETPPISFHFKIYRY